MIFSFSETITIVYCVAELPMMPGSHAERAPDGLAIVMGGSGETVSYAQLDERSRWWRRGRWPAW
jgi:hypothetical protein